MREMSIHACCTAKLICEFSGSRTYGVGTDNQITRSRLNDLEREIAEDGNAIIIAFTDSDQEEACRILKEAGYTGTGWASKPRHPETEIQLWYKHIGISVDEYHSIHGCCDDCTDCGMCCDD